MCLRNRHVSDALTFHYAVASLNLRKKHLLHRFIAYLHSQAYGEKSTSPVHRILAFSSLRRKKHFTGPSHTCILKLTERLFHLYREFVSLSLRNKYPCDFYDFRSGLLVFLSLQNGHIFHLYSLSRIRILEFTEQIPMRFLRFPIRIR